MIGSASHVFEPEIHQIYDPWSVSTMHVSFTKVNICDLLYPGVISNITLT